MNVSRHTSQSIIPLQGTGHSRTSGSWIYDVLSELCGLWSKRWDEHVGVACWIKYTMPDLSLPNQLTLLLMFFGRNPHAQLEVRLSQTAAWGAEDYITSWRTRDVPFGRSGTRLRSDTRADDERTKTETRGSKGLLTESQRRRETWYWYGKWTAVSTAKGRRNRLTRHQFGSDDGRVEETHGKCSHDERQTLLPATAAP